MRLSLTFVILLGLAVSVAAFVIFGGGKSMSMHRDDTGIRSGTQPSSAHLSDTFETATFALG